MAGVHRGQDEDEEIHFESFLKQIDENLNVLGFNVNQPIGPPPSSVFFYPAPVSSGTYSWSDENENENEKSSEQVWTRGVDIGDDANTTSFASLLRTKQPKNKPTNQMQTIYKLQFKQCHRHYTAKPGLSVPFSINDIVLVDADRGEDIGIIVAIVPSTEFQEKKPTAGFRGRGAAAVIEAEKFIIRKATDKERQQLIVKLNEENKALMVCREKAASKGYPMEIKDAEFQFDRHKLSFYYSADRRIDFRELVSDLFALYKTRIWMQQVDTSFVPNIHASSALRTGTYPTIDTSFVPNIHASSALRTGSYPTITHHNLFNGNSSAVE